MFQIVSICAQKVMDEDIYIYIDKVERERCILPIRHERYAQPDIHMVYGCVCNVTRCHIYCFSDNFRNQSYQVSLSIF